MFDKKSLTERVLELKEKYFQPDSIRRGILKTTASALLAIKLFSYCLMPVAASEPLNVKDYIKQNNYNLSTIFQLYLSPFDKDNILDENEKKVIDIIANAPEEKQEQGKALAKEIYNNKGLTPETLAKLEELNMPLEKQGPVETLEGKIIQEPENPVDIYAVIANGEDDITADGEIFGISITSVLGFYKLMKDIGVSDDNISLFLYNPHTEDVINTLTKKWLDYHFGKTHLPSSKSEISIDEEEVTLNKVLNAISSIPSDDNDFVYIMLSSHLNPEYTLRLPDRRLSYRSLMNAIKKIDYDRVFVILDSCYAGGFLKPLEKLDNYIGIGSSSKDKEPFAGVLPSMINKYLRENPDISVNELIEKANQDILNSKYYERRETLIVVFSSDEKLLNEALIPLDYLTK